MRDASIANGFCWTDEPWGRALRSTPLGAIADHFFTSLPLRLRGDDGQEEREWAQVAAAKVGGRGRVVAVDLLEVEPVPGAPEAVASRRVLYAPLLPVPGTLKLTADRRAVTWLEAETPTRLARVALAVDGSGPVAVTDRDNRAGSSSPRKSSRPPRRKGR